MPLSRLFPRVRAVVLAALVAVGGPLSAQSSSPEDDELEAPEVTKLTIRGVKAVDKAELEKSISTDESGCKGLILTPFCWISKSPIFYERKYLDREEFKRDVLRIRVFYWKRGWRHTTVDTVVSPHKTGVQVTFRVTEGDPTTVRKISVGPQSPVLSERDIQRSVSLRAGRPLNLLMLDSSVVSLRNKLWERGYADAVVKVDTVLVSDESKTGDVAISIDPRWRTTVAEMRIAGNEEISERTIRNSLTMREGDLFRRSDVIQSQRNLYESGLFRHATILVPPQGDSGKIVELTVREAPLHEARAAAGFNTVDFFQVQGRFRHYNILGGARRLEVSGVIGNLFAAQLNNRFIFRDPLGNAGPEFNRPTWQASAELKQPWFQSPRNTFSVGVFAHRRQAAPVFIDRGMGASATFTRELSQRTPLSATYRFEQTRVEAGDLYFCVYYGVCDTTTVNAQRRRQQLSPLAVTGLIDRTNEAFSPTAGFRGRVELEHASGLTVSDYRYNRAMLDAATYNRIGRTSVLALHARAGIVRAIQSTGAALGFGGGQADDVLHPRKRFYAGGSQSVRGFGENQLGPRALTLPRTKVATLLGCTDVSSVTAIASCDPNAPVVDSTGKVIAARLPEGDFSPRPLGGTSVVEASVEYRFPIWRALSGAAFVDGALVGEASLREIAKGTGAITPGAGIRYKSPVGPIRVDVGFNPSRAEELTVYTSSFDAEGRERIVALDTRRIYEPPSKLLDRLTFHFSIGQAF